VPHVGLAGFHIQLFIGCITDNLPQLKILVKFLFDALNIGIAVSGFVQFAVDISDRVGVTGFRPLPLPHHR